MAFIISCLAFLIMLIVAKKALAKEDTSLYTGEQIATARHNVKTYDWAKTELDQVLSKADPWTERSDEELWNLPLDSKHRQTVETRVSGMPGNMDQE